MSSSSLFSPLANPTNHQINLVLQAVQNYNPEHQERILVPSLTSNKVDYFIEEVLGMPDETVFHAASHRDYQFYYCRHNGQVYQVILRDGIALHVSRPQMLR